jgi:hypothetical protein
MDHEKVRDLMVDLNAAIKAELIERYDLRVQLDASANPEELRQVRAERDYFLERLVAMPSEQIMFKTKASLEAWEQWKKETFSADGTPLTLRTGQKSGGDE